MRAISLLLVLAACNGGAVPLTEPTDEPTDPTIVVTTTTPVTPEACVPDRAAFDANAMPAIERSCVTCHGATPQFGAPFSLLDYDALIAGRSPNRIVDTMVTALVDRTMPPASQGLFPHADLDTLTGWASCGLVHPDPSDGLISSRDVWEAPPNPPAGTTIINLSANNHFVDVDDIDDYQYFFFSNLTNEDVFIRRMEGVIDESRVVHHIVLNNVIGFDYLYTWAPGTGAIEFPDGGIRLTPNQRLVMNIHYNNGAGIPDVYDSSGIRLYVGPPVGTEWGMASPSVYDITVPGNSTATATDTCRATMDFEILAGMPHMHEIGSEFKHTITRAAGGPEETLIELTGWSFEAQYFYEMPTQIRSGDTLTLSCTFDNPNANTVHWGEGTQEEMCFDFLYVTPPAAAFQCFSFF